jgi:peptide/nickel transport system substrate-binding protein
MLKRAGADIRPEILDGSYRLPASNGSGRDRKNLRKALKLLNEAGWKAANGGLQNAAGEPFAFQIVVASRQQERIALAWQRMLRVIGVQMDIRQIDSAQFQRRLNTYDFDMIPFTWYNSLSPGNEQSFYWGTAGRTQEGTRNYMGADDPAIDKMIAELLAARDKGLVRGCRTRAGPAVAGGTLRAAAVPCAGSVGGPVEQGQAAGKAFAVWLSH